MRPPPPVAEARKFFEKNSYIPFKIFLNFQFRTTPDIERSDMSNYHRASHRYKETTPLIVDQGGTRAVARDTQLEDVSDRKPVSKTERALIDSEYARKTFKANFDAKGKNDAIHVNVSKAPQHAQNFAKAYGKKTGKDTYTIGPKKKK
jgi:hypothetical protein